MSTAENQVANPFAGAPVVAAPTASAAAVVQREVAEVQAAMAIAKRFPRDPVASSDRIKNAFTRPSLAEEGTYSFARGGQNVDGLSIRAAEQLARDWGNIQSGVIELTRANGVSEVMTYAWDLETNFKDEKRFQVRHWRDKKGGQGYQVSDERDIYEIVANVAARRKRACLLAVIPGDVQEMALQQIAVTMRTNIQVTPESIKAMVEYMAGFGITKEMIEKKIQRHVDAILPAQMLNLKKIVQALKDGMGVVADYFEVPDEPVPEKTEGATQTQTVKDKLKGKQGSGKADAKPAAGEDLGGYVPHYSRETAIAELKAAKHIEALEKAWAAIALDYEQSGRQVEPDIDETYKGCKKELQKL